MQILKVDSKTAGGHLLLALVLHSQTGATSLILSLLNVYEEGCNLSVMITGYR